MLPASRLTGALCRSRGALRVPGYIRARSCPASKAFLNQPAVCCLFFNAFPSRTACFVTFYLIPAPAWAICCSAMHPAGAYRCDALLIPSAWSGDGWPERAAGLGAENLELGSQERTAGSAGPAALGVCGISSLADGFCKHPAVKHLSSASTFNYQEVSGSAPCRDEQAVSTSVWAIVSGYLQTRAEPSKHEASAKPRGAATINTRTGGREAAPRSS